MSRTWPMTAASDAGLLDAHRWRVAEAGRDQRQRQVLAVAAADRATVEGGPAPAGGGEQLAEHRRVHGADEDPVGIGGGDRRRPVVEAVDEVGRAVDRVDVPRDARRPGVGGALLADDGVVRAGGRDPGDDRRLGGAVVGRDEIGGRGLRRGLERRRLLPGERLVAGLDGEPAGELGAARRSSSAARVVELAPLAEGAQDEHGDDAHPAGGDHRAGQDPEAEREPAVALALQLDEAVADQARRRDPPGRCPRRRPPGRRVTAAPTSGHRSGASTGGRLRPP